jgi:hypothetical protein
MRPQSCGSPSCWNFETPTWEFRDKKPFGCGPVESCRVCYMGEGGGFPRLWAVVSLVSLELHVVVLAQKVLKKVN